MKQLNQYIDHTNLKPDATKEKITQLCADARAWKFASVCVNPCNVSLAKECLADSGVMVCTVIGFPLGQNTTAAKVLETEDAYAQGCDEFDMVINIGRLKDGCYDYIKNEIAAVVAAAKGKTVKVIIETGLLTDEEKAIATRAANKEVMNALAALAPELVGGSADLEPSNKTGLKEYGWIKAGDFTGRNFHWGVRELAMAAIVNGLTAYEDFRAFGATFFVFSDYCRPAIRLAALMELPSIFIFSHDSFYVGEDGPTHEPIEQLAAMRTMPNVTSFRPADANETAYAWIEMLGNVKGPSCILTTRQNLPVLEGTSYEGVAKGAYSIWQAGRQDKETVLFLASGSEVALAVEAAKRLWNEDGRSVRVVSMPSMERFLAQKCTYRDYVVPEVMTRRVIVEAGSRFGWDRFRMNHKTTRFVTKDDFGASGPYKVLAEKFGFTAENVYNTAKELI